MWELSEGSADNYYCVMKLIGDGMIALKEIFPEGRADEMNLALFSTSGIHGDSVLIEDAEQEIRQAIEDGHDANISVTFCIVQPRRVCMRYGNATPRTEADIEFLKKLRSSSLAQMQSIGVP